MRATEAAGCVPRDAARWINVLPVSLMAVSEENTVRNGRWVVVSCEVKINIRVVG